MLINPATRLELVVSRDRGRASSLDYRPFDNSRQRVGSEAPPNTNVDDKDHHDPTTGRRPKVKSWRETMAVCVGKS